MHVSVQQIGKGRSLAPDRRLEVEAIAREAIGNALHHAGAQRVDVILDWTGRDLALFVIDDGVGLDPQLLVQGRPGHWGLQGMRERAGRIGARLTIRNRDRGGVEVRLDLGQARPARWWKRSLLRSRTA